MDRTGGLQLELCPICKEYLHKHPRYSICTILIGVGHTEQRGVFIGNLLTCPDHKVSDAEELRQALRNDIQLRKEYDQAPEMDLETEPIPRYSLSTVPDWLITPKEAAGLTGWNSHTVRVRIAKNKIEQLGWAVSDLGWKSGLYDRERVMAILKRDEIDSIDNS